MKNIPEILIKKAQELEERTAKRFPKLAPLMKQCFLNTIETTVEQLDDGSYFVITGDIPAMWLRDSAAQVKPYIKCAKESEEVREIIRSVIAKHAFYVNIDPYSNAFNASDSGRETPFEDHSDFKSGYIWERKYEVDSISASLYLAYEYYTATEDKLIFTDSLHGMIKRIHDTFKAEQNHDKTTYFFLRGDDVDQYGGRGAPVKQGIGLTWSFCRPSDDGCIYGYLIPANMMASVALGYGAELARIGWQDEELAAQCLALSKEIREAIEKYGVIEHPKYGKIYAYETDGFGNYNLMDDANSPSLMSIPYIGYLPVDDEVYQNTRRFILSKDNPHFYEGKVAKGVGSPHTPYNYIWHIALSMQALTSIDDAEIQYCMDAIAASHAGTNYMHESFNVDDPTEFTRPWFAWANTLFAQTVEAVLDREEGK